MTRHNPNTHARSAADALGRLLREVQSGRAGWDHPHTARQAAEDLARTAEGLAGAAQQLAAALAAMEHTGLARPRGAARQDADALLRAGQAATTAAGHLRQARRAMH
ncbi:hypothetical protein [Streptomyces axinellae]|uniref:Uncharacterized protein n=1 Tax=Streptomyces axinellae TaxID=552788 RepID=A0ABN3R2N8_9ACTN